MARKTTGSSNPNRSKKTAAPIQPSEIQTQVTQPADVQVAPEVSRNVPRKGKSSNVVQGNFAPANLNLEEEIRRRAYELYLQRRASAGNGNGHGDENQDWLAAEREIRSRFGSERHTA